MIKNTTKHQKAGWCAFIIYLMLLIYFMFFSEMFGRNTHAQENYAYNFILFKEIKRFITYREVIGMEIFLINIVGNVAGFMPIGFFLPVISRRGRKGYNTLLISLLFSLSIECTQLIFKVGSFDVDDLFLNTLGGAAGFIAYKIVQKIRRNIK